MHKRWILKPLLIPWLFSVAPPEGQKKSLIYWNTSYPTHTMVCSISHSEPCDQSSCDSVLSHHEHCLDIWWRSATNDRKNVKTPLAQNKDTRLALHCSMRTNIPQRERNLSWLSVENRWNASLLIFFRDVFNNKTQQYFINQDMSGLGYLLPPRLRDSDPLYFTEPSRMEFSHTSRTNIRDAFKAPICKKLIIVYHSKFPTRWCFGMVADPTCNWSINFLTDWTFKRTIKEYWTNWLYELTVDDPTCLLI